MKREDIEKLLGGYATGTLTPEERDALFAAALEDQELFDALAREEPLRAVLQDPAVKARLRALLPAPEPGYRRWLRATAWAVPAAGLAAIVATFVFERPAPRQPAAVARVRPFQRTEPVVPVPSPLPARLEKRPLPPLRVRPAESTPPPPDAALDQLAIAVPLARSQVRSGRPIRLEAASAQIAPGVPVPDARALFFGASPPPVVQTSLVEPERPLSAAPFTRVRRAAPGQAGGPAAYLGLRYSIVRTLENGQTAAVNPAEPAGPGTEIRLRVEPNEAGYLYVFERVSDGWQLLSSSRVERMAPYDVPQTGGLAFEKLFVVFARQPLQRPYPVPEERLDQLLSGNAAEGATYVVSTAAVPAAQTLAFPITLTRK